MIQVMMAISVVKMKTNYNIFVCNIQYQKSSHLLLWYYLFMKQNRHLINFCVIPITDHFDSSSLVPFPMFLNFICIPQWLSCRSKYIHYIIPDLIKLLGGQTISYRIGNISITWYYSQKSTFLTVRLIFWWLLPQMHAI